MDAMIYVANGLNLMSYFVRDILQLRALTIVAVACLAMYFVSRPEPLMEVVYWNLFFLVLNALQIVRLVLLRRRDPTRGRTVAPPTV